MCVCVCVHVVERVQRFCSCGSGKPEDCMEEVSSRERRGGSQTEEGEPKL